jgi:hypothetical protein
VRIYIKAKEQNMSKGASLSLGVLLMNIAVAAYLFATGIIGLAGRNLKTLLTGGGDIRMAVESLFGRGDLSNILIIVLAVLAIVAGVFILLKLFGVKISGLDMILVILAIVWLAFIILVDIIYPLKNRPDFLAWLLTFSCHLMALGGLLVAGQKK